ncbi:MAG: AAA family ATPase [Alphaproteobacteria bacterium]
MYAEHFGFSEFPFRVAPDPQVFFNNSLYQEAFATLQYGVLAKKGFVVITGEVGTGKTTLLRKLLHSLGPTVHSVFIFNTQVSFVELLRLILDDLNLAHNNDDKLTMIEILNQYLIERLRQGHIVTLLIDEAQNLCDEALEGLRLLSNLETDTEKLLQIVLMGQPELEIKLDQLKLRQLKQRITLQCRLAPLKKEEVGAYIEFRLNAVGFRDKNPFHPACLEAIAFYSKGIPRLVNIICDNALLAAYAVSKKKVSVQMVEEVARDLRLGSPRPIEAEHPVNHKMADDPAKLTMEKKRLPEFENIFVAAEKEYRPKLQPKHSLTGLGVGVLLGAVCLGGIAVSYPEQSKVYLSDLAASWGDFSRDLKALAAWMGESARPYWQSLMRVQPITDRSDDNFSTVRLADSSDMKPNKEAEPLFGGLAPVADTPPLISQDLSTLAQGENVPLPAAQEPAEALNTKNTGLLTESHATSDSSKAQRAESHQLPALKHEPFLLKRPSKGQRRDLGNFKVVEQTFVRDTPESDAAIIATLQPGTWVRVESKTGKYLRVRSLNDRGVRGYVHEEDAFFKRIK